MPALASWHEQHDACRRLATGTNIPAHSLIESFSVLTRLPSSLQMPADVAGELLTRWFPPKRVLIAPAALQREALARLREAGVAGGAVYDGLIALTAKEHGEGLLTFDQRAVRTYEALGVEFELLQA